jgi:mono/diheme cytochrome c family protein
MKINAGKMFTGAARGATLAYAGLALACAFAACSRPRQSEAAPSSTATAVERGRYLVNIIGCGDCHTPKKMGPNGPEPDLTRDLSGHPEQETLPGPPTLSGPWAAALSGDMTAWAGPWGESFTANLTPDRNTGLGIWTEDMFVKAMRTGKHMGVSRPILPPMPWQHFAQMSDADLVAIYAYLRTIKPVVNHVPDPVPPAHQ